MKADVTSSSADSDKSRWCFVRNWAHQGRKAVLGMEREGREDTTDSRAPEVFNKKQQQNTETIPISFFSLPKLFVGWREKKKKSRRNLSGKKKRRNADSLAAWLNHSSQGKAIRTHSRRAGDSIGVQWELNNSLFFVFSFSRTIYLSSVFVWYPSKKRKYLLDSNNEKRKKKEKRTVFRFFLFCVCVS